MEGAEVGASEERREKREKRNKKEKMARGRRAKGGGGVRPYMRVTTECTSTFPSASGFFSTQAWASISPI
jgi:hypothetical protein